MHAWMFACMYTCINSTTNHHDRQSSSYPFKPQGRLSRPTHPQIIIITIILIIIIHRAAPSSRKGGFPGQQSAQLQNISIIIIMFDSMIHYKQQCLNHWPRYSCTSTWLDVQNGINSQSILIILWIHNQSTLRATVKLAPPVGCNVLGQKQHKKRQWA